MKAEQFTKQIHPQPISIMPASADIFYQQSRSLVMGNDDKELLAVALDNLCRALEELRIHQEKLDEQNQKLAAAKQELEIERQYYHDLFEFAPEGYIITDPDGTIQQANQAAAALLNVSQQFLIGKSLASFINNQGWQEFRSKLLHLRQKGDKQDLTVQLQPRNHPSFDANLTVAGVGKLQGNLHHLRLILRDTRDGKQTAHLMRKLKHQNLQLVEASQIKSNFLAVVSHELRTPLTAILGFCQLLLRQSQNGWARERIHLLERIFSNSQNLLSRINDILDFAKLEARQLELQRQEFNIVELVTETTEQLSSLAQQKNLNLEVDILLPNPQIVNDKIRLQQVLLNLLSNAIKFTNTGSVLVKVWEVLPDIVAIAVCDTGIGIAPPDQPYIFESFRQVDQSLSRHYNGAGLGLAITQALVHLMGGTITVNSQLGEGSTFQVELPRQISTTG